MHHRSKLPYFFLGLAAIISAAALVMLVLRPGMEKRSGPPKTPQVTTPTAPPEIPHLTDPEPVENPAKVLSDLGIGSTATDPAVLVEQIAKALEAGDISKVGKLIGKGALDPQTVERLKALSATPLKLKPNGVREVGELELNARSRWSLELADQQAGRDRILLDLKRDNNKWGVEKITLPPGPNEPIPKAQLADSLGVADAFLQAVLHQDFEFARAFVDPATVSDAKIAGLCILFEEGEYRMRKSKPLRSMFSRGDTVGYLANVETGDGSQSAEFAMNLKQPPGPSKNWIVSEINLNQLLADYAKRVSGGDLYYTPLVKNPAGGDTLALYFEFDQDEMNPRTRRQLEIVSMILKADPGKKITLSGHTDALGTKEYNNSLSSRRADVVRDYLTAVGVDAKQIVTVAKGDSQPRRPNVTETGTDNPEGRRVNRRTEIYLDF